MRGKSDFGLPTVCNSEGVCLNVGCGTTVSEGWNNIDASPSLRLSRIPLFGRFLAKLVGSPKWPRLVKYGDIVTGLPYASESCGLIFMSHVLEHMAFQDFHTALANVYRYLIPNGIFRLIVPDLEVYAASYVNRLNGETGRESAAIDFVRETHLGCQTTRRGLYERIREVLANSTHRWMWDGPSLTHALARHGFRKIRRSRFGEWSDQRFSLVETRERHENSICIETVK